jgi:hypothetical protein
MIMRMLGIVLISTIVFSCSEKLASTASTRVSPHAASFKKMEWLIGSWKGMAGANPFYEAWRKVNDTLIANYGIQIKGSDTIITQGSPINVHSGGIYLGMKDSTNWKLTQLADSLIIFQNDTLRFSNVITWRLTPEGHWFTTLKHPRRSVDYDILRFPALDRLVDAYHRQTFGR